MEALDTHSLWIIAVFFIGYFFITIEHATKIDKATVALLMGIICWVIQFAYGVPACEDSLTCLGEHLSSISQVIFFLLGALAIVEVINIHKGFSIISDNIKVNSKRGLLWTIGILAFFLSAVLDNLTTTIVMITLLQKIVRDPEDRLLIGGGVVVAANAGGAWTPIGDVTTTMLWIGGEISTFAVMRDLLAPSLVCFVVAFACLSFMLKGDFAPNDIHVQNDELEPMGKLVFFLGIAALVFVPIFKIVTGLPPFMGVLLGLSVLWLVTDLIHSDTEERDHLRMSRALTRIDFSGLLFFLGILLAIDAMDAAKILEKLAYWLNHHIASISIIALFIGFASAVVDNVPLVAATMGMYDLTQYPTDHPFWELVAYCAGTGGSILIIGSAAGVVYMGLEKVNFYWYLKKISLPALLGYLAGIGVYLMIFHH